VAPRPSMTLGKVVLHFKEYILLQLSNLVGPTWQSMACPLKKPTSELCMTKRGNNSILEVP